MDFIEKVQEISQRIPKQIDHIQTEEATKSAFVMPFIQALGYDVFNPLEVIPEYTADHGTKKGEKVDYAIRNDDKITMLIECKWCGTDLAECHASQLFRYFSVSSARFGILTNGIYYKFYSDLDEPNKMDKTPFFEFDLQQFDEDRVTELRKFSKGTFDLEDILTTANELKYTNAIKRYFKEQLNTPSPEFIRFFAGQVYTGRLTQPVVEQFLEVVQKALKQFLRERVKDRLQSALDSDTDEPVEAREEADEPELEEGVVEVGEGGIVTTQEEFDAFQIVKAIGAEAVDVDRIFMRDRVTYCGILLDDNNRKPICRLHFNTQQKRVGLIKDKTEERVDIDRIEDLYKYAGRIKEAIKEYLEE